MEIVMKITAKIKKHLRGQHDQSTHNPHIHAVSKPSDKLQAAAGETLADQLGKVARAQSAKKKLQELISTLGNSGVQHDMPFGDEGAVAVLDFWNPLTGNKYSLEIDPTDPKDVDESMKVIAQTLSAEGFDIGVKHLTGQHDQQSHDPTKGQRNFHGRNVTDKLPSGYKGQVKITTYYSGMNNFVTSNTAVTILQSKDLNKYFSNVTEDAYYTIEPAEEKQMGKITVNVKLKGGPGSGHHGHSGRPGKVGGSQPGKGGSDKKKPKKLTHTFPGFVEPGSKVGGYTFDPPRQAETITGKATSQLGRLEPDAQGYGGAIVVRIFHERKRGKKVHVEWSRNKKAGWWTNNAKFHNLEDAWKFVETKVG
jgi:hypothetical protein